MPSRAHQKLEPNRTEPSRAEPRQAQKAYADNESYLPGPTEAPIDGDDEAEQSHSRAGCLEESRPRCRERWCNLCARERCVQQNCSPSLVGSAIRQATVIARGTHQGVCSTHAALPTEFAHERQRAAPCAEVFPGGGGVTDQRAFTAQSARPSSPTGDVSLERMAVSGSTSGPRNTRDCGPETLGVAPHGCSSFSQSRVCPAICKAPDQELLSQARPRIADEQSRDSPCHPREQALDDDDPGTLNSNCQVNWAGAREHPGFGRRECCTHPTACPGLQAFQPPTSSRRSVNRVTAPRPSPQQTTKPQATTVQL